MLPELRLRDPRPRVRAEQRGDAHPRDRQRCAARSSRTSRASTCSTSAAETAPAEPNLLLIRVDYRLRANNAIGNLVYPFYLHEAA